MFACLFLPRFSSSWTPFFNQIISQCSSLDFPVRLFLIIGKLLYIFFIPKNSFIHFICQSGLLAHLCATVLSLICATKEASFIIFLRMRLVKRIKSFPLYLILTFVIQNIFPILIVNLLQESFLCIFSDFWEVRK